MLRRLTSRLTRVFALGAAAMWCAACLSLNVRTVGAPRTAQVPIKRVAVAPLLNRTGNPAAGAIIAQLLYQKLATRTSLELKELPQDIEINPERLDRTRAQEIATKLEVDALITGTIFAFEYTPNSGSAAAPNVRLDLRMVTAATGDVIWAVAADAGQEMVLTNDSRPLTEVAEKLTGELCDNLKKSL